MWSTVGAQSRSYLTKIRTQCFHIKLPGSRKHLRHNELGVLVAKGTFGFGGVLYAGSLLLRQIFNVVSTAKSSETFVAAALLVAVGMGQVSNEPQHPKTLRP